MDDDNLNFWEHLQELRKYLIRSVLFFFILFIAAFLFREILFDNFLLALLDEDFITYRVLKKLFHFIGVNDLESINAGFKLINFKLSGQFLAHISISAVAAAIITLPFFIYQMWLFIKPALYPKERKIISKNAIIIVFLFLIGCLFAYYVITPLSILFLGNYKVSELVSNTISLNSYISVFNSTLFLTGLLFELPILLLVISRLGLVSAETLRKYRKYSIVACLIISAIITPTTDPFTMTIIAIPIYLLYEISIFSINKKSKKWQQK